MIWKNSIFFYKIESSNDSTGANELRYFLKMYVYVSSVPKVYIDRYVFSSTEKQQSVIPEPQ